MRKNPTGSLGGFGNMVEIRQRLVFVLLALIVYRIWYRTFLFLV